MISTRHAIFLIGALMERGYNIRKMKCLASYIWNQNKKPDSKVNNENEVSLSLIYNSYGT